ncbi:hypothetical protein J6590_003730 [Homalodisca vitripennis]|nr:hypothetical protein J6590_003730 [Homalodisca vitripennis]
MGTRWSVFQAKLAGADIFRTLTQFNARQSTASPRQDLFSANSVKRFLRGALQQNLGSQFRRNHGRCLVSDTVSDLTSGVKFV